MRIVNDIAVELATYLKEDVADVVMNLSSPPRSEMGDVAFPCFRLAKRFRKSPQDIANDLKTRFETEERDAAVELLAKIERIETAGGYLNFFIKRDYLARSIIRESIEGGDRPGASSEGEGKTVIVEYSSPNIAKPFHVGHGFSTFLGEAVANLYEYGGYKVERFNHLGDYGTQFGKLIVAWKLWGDADALQESPIDELTRIYVKFHDVAENNPELEDEARAAFGRLEQGGKDELALWQQFRDVSLREFNRIYERLGIHFDNTNGESFYSPMIPAVVDELKEKNLLIESEGAQVVDLEEFGLNPCLILKSDGSTIYASRDIASILYRKREYKFYKNIYVVGIPQMNHFNQVFAVMEKMGFPNPESNMHVAFGTVKFADGAFSTRTGNVIILEDLLDTSVAKTRAIIEENNPTMESAEIDDIAEKIGVGAVRYTFLRNGRERDIVFSWEDVLDFEGESAPYLLYTVTRCASLERRAPESLLERVQQIGDEELELLVSDDEQELLKEISRFPASVISARESHEPSVMMRQVMTIARAFNAFYHNAHILRAENEALGAARLVLAQVVGRTISAGLRIAGIEPVERM
ncbi:MAG: arginine--tRNA ligase [Saccharofermentanales bacterium]|jgi:arginyl-tRNA synthetase